MDAMTAPDARPSALDALDASVVVLAGHFGSGKSEIAVNLALGLRARGEDVSLVDLDVVKPYFRCRLAKDELDACGVSLVVPEGDRFWADLPIVVPLVRGSLRSGPNRGARVILDIGGDDLGARALGSVGDAIDAARTEFLFVVNTRRPFAEDGAAVAAMLRDVEAVARLKVTGLVANSHLMDETTPDVVLEGVAVARELAASLGVPLRFAAVLERLIDQDPGLVGRLRCPVLPVRRRLLPPELRRPQFPRRRPMGI